MKNLVAFWLAMVLWYIGLPQQVQKPFPNHTQYYPHLKPSNYTQQQLDSITSSFYEQWKAAYLRNDCDDTTQYYVYFGPDAINVSEGQGYGMMITAFMAGYDPEAKTYFDGLYRFYKAHPSNIDSLLMDWQQITCNDDPSDDDNSASDGDIDIAFALLLAHQQWGSNGTINYLNEALRMLQAIMQDDINQQTWTVKLGDWSNVSEPGYFYSTRTSDFITDHFRSFAQFSQNSDWYKVVDTCYALINLIQTQYSPETGLLPDFIVELNSNPHPANANFLEGQHDGHYYYNACRDPWRLATDYLIFGSQSAYQAVVKINQWLRSATNGDPGQISNGYYLDGTPIYDWNDVTFVAPFTVGAMLDTDQTWLNQLFEQVINESIDQGDYYSNTLKMLALLVISGNYWNPEPTPTALQNRPHSEPKITVGVQTIKLENLLPKSQLLLMDLNGRRLKKLNACSQTTEMDISELPAGVYLLNVRAEEFSKTYKIVKP